MYKLATAVAALVFTSLGAPVFAQENQTAPTDADLRAGYCLGVILGKLHNSQACEIAVASSKSNSEADVKLRESAKQVCNEEQSDLNRLKDYLTARGYLLGESDPFPILVAKRRGDEDFSACTNEAISNTETKACLDRCQAVGATADIMACSKTCPLPDACRRVRRCNDLSFLPF
jgi:hypothetical protein